MSWLGFYALSNLNSLSHSQSFFYLYILINSFFFLKSNYFSLYIATFMRNLFKVLFLRVYFVILRVILELYLFGAHKVVLELCFPFF